MLSEKDKDELYPSIGEIAEGEEQMPAEVESLCMSCGKNGVTRLLFTRIPFFREIIVMSFRCPHCGEANNEIQPGSAVQNEGSRYVVTLTSAADLQRELVKSDSGTFKVRDIDFEIPPGKGVLTTIEGLLQTALDQLKESQEERRKVDAEVAAKVGEFIPKLAMCLCGVSFPFTVELDDPAGNSFVQNLMAPKQDPNMKFTKYLRSKEQQQQLGLQIQDYELTDEQKKENEREEVAKTFVVKEGATIVRGEKEKRDDSTMMEKEVYEIQTNCPNCGTPGLSKTCVTDIPFFKEVIIMGFDCTRDDCGYKTNEIKGGGAIPEKGRILRLTVPAGECKEDWVTDMKRDVVKSNSAGVSIPELDIEITAGSLGGMYTTVEGLLSLAKNTLFEGQAADFVTGDSGEQSLKEKFEDLERRFEKVVAGEMSFTLEIKDPLANSFIYSPTAPEPEPRLEVIDYERTFEENEELGLNDMLTENYDSVKETIPSQPEQPPQDPASVQATMRDLQHDGIKSHPHPVSKPT